MREGEVVDRGASRYLICHISVTPAHTSKSAYWDKKLTHIMALWIELGYFYC